MTPILWVAAGGILATALGFGGGVVTGMGIGEDKEYAKRAREDSLVQKVADASQAAAAQAIAKIKPRNTTIRQEIQRETKTNTVYTDCHVPAAGVRLVNEAITGIPGTDPVGGGVVSEAKPAKPPAKR